jgi:hypothetical protein
VRSNNRGATKSGFAWTNSGFVDPTKRSRIFV